MAWGERNTPTEHHHIVRTPDGRYAVLIRRKTSKYYKNGFESILDAIKARDATLRRLAELDARYKEETYGKLIPDFQQCMRCTLPHLPDSVYCEYHQKRYDGGHYEENETSCIRERKAEIVRLQTEWLSQQDGGNMGSGLV